MYCEGWLFLIIIFMFYWNGGISVEFIKCLFNQDVNMEVKKQLVYFFYI